MSKTWVGTIMWRKNNPDHEVPQIENSIDDFAALLRYVEGLAAHKMGYPVSLLSYLGVINNEILGIKPDSLANVLLNNVGDPFKDSETSLMEVKKHERELIFMLERFYGMPKNTTRGYVTTGGTEGNFAGLWWSKRYLINLLLPQLIELDDAIKLKIKEEKELNVQLVKIPKNDFEPRAIQLQKIIDIRDTIGVYKDKLQQLLTPTVFYTKGHTHYSIPKIAEILRLNIREVQPNADGSMDLAILKRELILHLGAHPRSPIIIIANIGTTITGAIDDVPGIKKAMDELSQKPSYTIHLDGALTGFVMPVLKPFGEIQNYFTDLGVNTLAVSAHKYPGLSQPCGILLAKRDFFEKAFEKSERSIDYVGNILDVTITGSRSGLNVLMFYNALKTLELDKDAAFLKKLVQENLQMADYLYKELIKLYGAEKVSYPYHFNVTFPKPSMSLAKKYQLMVTGERATICVLTNITKELVDRFIRDLTIDVETSTMLSTHKKPDYIITILQAEHIPSTVELFVKTFCDSEPITRHLGMSYREYQPFAMEVVRKAAQEGLSYVAIDKNNKVIACSIGEDLSHPFKPQPSHYPKLKPILALLEELDKPFISGREFKKGKIIHVWIAAVDSTYRGQGLSTIINMACIEGAARRGYEFAYAEFTNDISENVTHHFKMLELCNKISYDEFQYDNDFPFKGVEGGTNAYVASIKPGMRLESLAQCYSAREEAS